MANAKPKFREPDTSVTIRTLDDVQWEKAERAKARQEEANRKAIAARERAIAEAKARADAWRREKEAPKDVVAKYRVINVRGRVTAKQVIQEVADRAGLSYEEIVGPRRREPIVKARQEAMWEVSRRCPHLNLPQIARAFNRDHTTVLWGVKRENERRGEKARAA